MKGKPQVNERKGHTDHKAFVSPALSNAECSDF